MLYTHYYGFFMLLFENLYFLLFIRSYRVQIKKCMILQFIVLICFLPWLPTMLEQTQLALKGIVPPQLSANPEFSMAYLETLNPSPNLLIVLSSYLSFQGYSWFPYTLYPELIFYAALSVFGIYFSLKRNLLTFENIFFVILWLIIPVLTPFIISQRFNLLFNWRYLIFVSPAYLILISNGIINIGKKYTVLGIFLLWLVIMHSVIGLPSYYAFGQKEQWREVAQYIKENELTEDLILADPGWIVPAFKYYYDASSEIVGVVSSRNMNSNQDYFESIQCKVEKAKRIWLILSDTPAKGFYKKKLLEYCQQINVKDYINVQVILFAKNEIFDSR